MKKIIRGRNPLFEFDPNVTVYMILSLSWNYLVRCLRGAILFSLHLRPSRFMALDRGVRFFNLPRITFGRFVKIGRYSELNAMGKTGIKLGNNVGIGDFSKLVVSSSLGDLGAYIMIGDDVGIGEYAYLGGAGGLSIGDECIIGQYFSCHPENHIHTDLQLAIRWQGVKRNGIKIGRNCWIGSKVTILDGVQIGDGCIIAAGAVVNRSFPANSIIGGIPAKLIKTRES